MNFKPFSIYIIAGIILSACLVSCVSQRVSVIESFNYDAQKNISTYSVLPYGSIDIPGKWDKGKYNSNSFQQWFIDKDSISIAIAIGSYQGFEFNQDGSKQGMDFLKAYYKWEADYFLEKHGLTSEIIEQNTDLNYIIFLTKGTNQQANVETYYLFCEKNGNVFNLSIPISGKWYKNTKIEFLKKLISQSTASRN